MLFIKLQPYPSALGSKHNTISFSRHVSDKSQKNSDAISRASPKETFFLNLFLGDPNTILLTPSWPANFIISFRYLDVSLRHSVVSNILRCGFPYSKACIPYMLIPLSFQYSFTTKICSLVACNGLSKRIFGATSIFLISYFFNNGMIISLLSGFHAIFDMHFFILI